MLNLWNQTKLNMAVMLLTAAPLFAQQDGVKSRPQKSFEQGNKLTNAQLMPGYNAPASIKVADSWDVYATASYIYWQAQQENLEIGLISQNDPQGTAGGNDAPFTTSYKNNMSVTDPNFTYRPGFKFGIGANLGWDGWDAFAEYTWFHGSVGSGVTPLTINTNNTLPPNGQYLYPIQLEEIAFQDEAFYQDADQSWRLKMDLLDVSMGRSYYSGTKLTVRPFFGARGAWIRQVLDTTYNAMNFSPQRQAESNNASISWGLGPRAGFDSNWLLGYGLRLIGIGSADILYTRYETRKNDQTVMVSGSTNPIIQNATVNQTIDYLRGHVDLEMGFGWGSYFDNDNWHVDLSASYGFQIFWDQTMFRNFEEPKFVTKSFAPNGNLYVHGLTVNGRLDF